MADHLHLTELTKRYGDRTVVDAVDLTIEAGRFYTLLGPSGCGKTTTLRMIAGLERPDGGTVRLGGRMLSGGEVFVEPEKRGMGMVFQSYAVWPHMTVAGNVEFPLKLRGVAKAERGRRVAEVLELVGLAPFARNPATNLSGGQQQRVAIARALVYRPEVLLLDEPLSNLDAKLREQMRVELRDIQRRFGTTTIMVTHDQGEAMAVSDRVVVMSGGRIEQIGTPEEVYAAPRSAFVMDFLGPVNTLAARAGEGGELVLAGAEAPRFRLPAGRLGDAPAEGPVTLGLRLEDLTLVPPDQRRADDWAGRVESATFLGQRVGYIVRVGDSRLRIEGPAAPRFATGDAVYLRPDLAAVRVWPAASPAALGQLSSAGD